MNRVRDPIDRHLETLEPVTASAGFTERVMDRIERTATERSSLGPLRLGWAVAGTAALTLVILTLLMRTSPADFAPSENRAIRLAEMRRQHALLAQELAMLRSRAQDTAPVIYLGSVDEIDYVWDLSPLLERQAGRAVPASSRRAISPEFTKELP